MTGDDTQTVPSDCLISARTSKITPRPHTRRTMLRVRYAHDESSPVGLVLGKTPGRSDEPRFLPAQQACGFCKRMTSQLKSITTTLCKDKPNARVAAVGWAIRGNEAPRAVLCGSATETSKVPFLVELGFREDAVLCRAHTAHTDMCFRRGGSLACTVDSWSENRMIVRLYQVLYRSYRFINGFLK